jgi:hypothetical protein
VTLASTAVATLAGSSSGYLDATGTSARFNKQQGIEVGPSGDVYVADTLNHRIRKVTAAGVVTTVAGAGAGSADGVGTAATFDEPSDVTLDGSGFLYVADNTNNLLRRIDLGTGTVTTLVGSGTAASTDGNGTLAAFDDPTSLTYDGANAAIWVVEGVGHRVRKVY